MSYPQLLTPADKLAQAKHALLLPTIVCICGSTRFMAEMAKADLRETAKGRIVVKPGCDMKTPHELWADPAEAEQLKERLDGLHRAKLRLADEVLVVGDYVGESTTAEIAYARELGLPVRFTHPEVDPARQDTDPADDDAEPCGEGMCQCSCVGTLHPCGCDCPRCPYCQQDPENCDCDEDE